MIFDVAVNCASDFGAHFYKRFVQTSFISCVYSSIPPIYTKEGDRSNILFRSRVARMKDGNVNRSSKRTAVHGKVTSGKVTDPLLIAMDP